MIRRKESKRNHRARPWALCAAAAALALAGAAPHAVADEAPIKIGVLLPLSGNFAANGKQALAGMEIYLDQIGKKAGGHPLVLDVED
ncbi:MAG: ABC transporter substrate-binding protein, partial [Stellaceae bacterium]